MNCLFCHNPLIMGMGNILPNFDIFNDLNNYIVNLFLKGISQNTKKYLFALGTLSLSMVIYQKIQRLIKNCNCYLSHHKNMKNLNRQNILEKYGQCWIGITGFTDGIGWAYANLFAKMGFNLILIGRGDNKVNSKAELLNQIYPKSKHITIVADLSKDNQIQIVVNRLNSLSKQIQIGIFINNAGFSNVGHFLQLQAKDLLQCTKVNFNAVTKISSEVIKIFLQRQKKSALINVSSCMSHYIAPYTGAYTLSKKMQDIYTGFLDRQHGDKIDFLSVRPFGVITKMTDMSRGPVMITPMASVKASISDFLAGHKITFTGIKHKYLHSLLQSNKQEKNIQFWEDYFKKITSNNQ